jgi:hypothetical protein
MTESTKNFGAIAISTLIFILGIASIYSFIMVVDSFFALDWLVLSLVLTGIFAISLHFGQKSERIKAALEYPFTFFG